MLVQNVDKYASQSQAEVNATIFVVAKKLGINTRNYNLKDVCQWGIDKDTKTLKESLKYMQKFTNYFVKDFESQEKISKIEKQETMNESISMKINEIASLSNIQDIAKDYGLTYKNDNIIVVK